MTALEIVLSIILYLIGYFFTVYKIKYDGFDNKHIAIWFFMIFIWYFPFSFQLVTNGIRGCFTKPWD